MQTLNIKTAIQNLNDFKNESKNKLHRYNSWEFCYKNFKKKLSSGKKISNEDIDFLSKELTIFLASWGMMRGSSKLLTQYNYKIHNEMLKNVLKIKDITELYIEPKTEEEIDDYIKLTTEVYEQVKTYYIKNKISPESKTLPTKILLGCFGCSPAYDDNFKTASNKYEDFTDTSTEKSGKFIKKLLDKNWEYYSKHKEELRKTEKIWPPMKIMDAILFNIGKEINEKLKKQPKS